MVADGLAATPDECRPKQHPLATATHTAAYDGSCVDGTIRQEVDELELLLLRYPVDARYE